MFLHNDDDSHKIGLLYIFTYNTLLTISNN